ncbi:hypothetical protein ES708_22339 [subsurface metagenome]
MNEGKNGKGAFTMSAKKPSPYIFACLCTLALILIFPPGTQATNYPEIHCKHFIYGYPTGTPFSNDLIIRDIYALSSNDETKFADWVAYRLDKETLTGDVETSRKWRSDPWLNENETLEPSDYKGAHAALKVDRGHQAPLASFKGTSCWHETNYLSNITPQKSDLNQGPWRILENKVRNLVKAGKVVYVLTGPLYGREMAPLPGADEPHKVPSGYWKIIIVQPDKSYDSIKTTSFIFDQETPRKGVVIDHLCTINEIETKTGLDFLRDLPDAIEEKIEGSIDRNWSDAHFK